MRKLGSHRKFFPVVVAFLAAVGSANSWAADSFEDLALRCAPDVHPATMRVLVEKESAFDPLVIGVNGTPHETIHAKSSAEASELAAKFLKSGTSADFGLGQINSRNLQRLGLSAASVFEPCRNLAAAARLLSESYRSFRTAGMDEASALDAAISAYNTGTGGAGITNGYVGDVHARAFPVYVVPSILDGRSDRASGATAGAVQLVATPATPPTPPATWDVFGDFAAQGGDLVTLPQTGPLERAPVNTPVDAERVSTNRPAVAVPPEPPPPDSPQPPADGPVVLFAIPPAAEGPPGSGRSP